ncbi:cathepsin W [Anolis carolinensis]|uniref:cathepsin W n=1 Tax=Anolis carolinensis TaxID=28377 RepID=UPI002F2B3353
MLRGGTTALCIRSVLSCLSGFLPRRLYSLADDFHSLPTTSGEPAPTMWSAAFCLCAMLSGAWIPAVQAQATLPPDLSMTQTVRVFQDFMRQFNKTYQSPEEAQHRFKAFVHNLGVSRALQASELGTAQYGTTRFSDLTEGEFAEMYGMSRRSRAPPVARADGEVFSFRSKSCDWRKAGAITEVKDQGKCRSCWAFATVSNIEALWNIHQRVQRNLSVQEIIDCSSNTTGCQGGHTWDGFLSVFESGGLSSCTLYPYVGKDQPCQKYRKRRVTPIDGFQILPRDEKNIATIVASKGPVTAEFNMKFLQNYQNGIIQRPAEDCDPNYRDHVGLIVGFNEGKSRRGSRTGPYWIIQNSWGEHWGEKGYFRLHRGTNACGIAMFVATATVKDSTTKKPMRCPHI